MQFGFRLIVFIVVFLGCVSTSYPMDYLRYWTQESEYIVIARISSIQDLPVRGGTKNSEPIIQKVCELEVINPIKGKAVDKLFFWGTSADLKSDKPTLYFLDKYNGIKKNILKYQDKNGKFNDLLFAYTRMPILSIDGIDYVQAKHEDHLPAYIHPQNSQVKLEIVLDAIRNINRKWWQLWK